MNNLEESNNNFTEKEIEAIKVAGDVISVSFEEAINNSSRIEDNLIYISIPVRGGSSIIINPDNMEYLYADSSVNFDDHLKEFKNGRRSN